MAFMLIGMFAFANNSSNNLIFENSNELLNSVDINTNDILGDCYVYLGYYDEDGNRVGGSVIVIPGVETEQDCDDLANWIGEILDEMFD